MKYKIKVSEFKKRLNYNKSEVTKNVMRFLLDSTEGLSNNMLVLRKVFLNKAVTRSSVSFIHNRCVMTLRHVLCLDCLKCPVIKLNVMVLMGLSMG